MTHEEEREELAHVLATADLGNFDWAPGAYRHKAGIVLGAGYRLESVVRAEQIAKDAALAKGATRIGHDQAEVRGYHLASEQIASAISAQLIEREVRK